MNISDIKAELINTNSESFYLHEIPYKLNFIRIHEIYSSCIEYINQTNELIDLLESKSINLDINRFHIKIPNVLSRHGYEGLNIILNPLLIKMIISNILEYTEIIKYTLETIDNSGRYNFDSLKQKVEIKEYTFNYLRNFRKFREFDKFVENLNHKDLMYEFKKSTELLKYSNNDTSICVSLVNEDMDSKDNKEDCLSLRPIASCFIHLKNMINSSDITIFQENPRSKTTVLWYEYEEFYLKKFSIQYPIYKAIDSYNINLKSYIWNMKYTKEKKKKFRI